jgi:hypothetical protein
MVAMRLPTICRPTLLFEESGSCRLPAKVRPEKVSQKKQHIKKKFKFFCRGKSALEVRFAQENRRMHTLEHVRVFA